MLGVELEERENIVASPSVEARVSPPGRMAEDHGLGHVERASDLADGLSRDALLVNSGRDLLLKWEPAVQTTERTLKS